MTQKDDYTFSPLLERHIAQIAEIERRSFSVPWSEQTLRGELFEPLSLYIVCEKQGEVLGYIGTRLVVDECHITNIATRPQSRREGIASMLVGRLERHLRQNGYAFMTLEVRQSNAPARAFYEKHGFADVGLRPGYYELPDEDAILMTKQLEDV